MNRRSTSNGTDGNGPSPMIRIHSGFVALALCLTARHVALAQSPNFQWAARAGGTNDADSGNGVAVSSAGTNYATGFFRSTTADFGNVTLTNAGVSDIYVAKYDPAGNVIWARSAGGTNHEAGNAIAVDSVGNCYVTGHYEGTATFGGTNLTVVGGYDVFVAKYSSAGNLLWVVSAGGTNFDEGTGVAVDDRVNIYVTGYHQETAFFGAVTLTNGINSDIFVAKLDPNGVFLWAKQAGGNNNDVGRGIAVDVARNCHATGLFNSSNAYFGGVFVTNRGSYDAFVASYDTAGSLRWATNAGGSANDGGYGVGVDANTNSYVTGYFGSTNASFGGFMLSTFGSSDIFVAKYNPTGAVAWARQAGGTSSDTGRGIAVERSGSSYVIGPYSSTTATFGSLTVSNAGISDIFFARYNSAGNVLWVTRAGGAAAASGLGVGFDAAGNVYGTGNFGGTAPSGGTNLVSAGNIDVFEARLGNFPPSLRIQLAGGQQVVLAWPATAAAWQLESATNLSTASWGKVTNGPVMVGSEYVVTNSTTGLSRFFRLRKL